MAYNLDLHIIKKKSQPLVILRKEKNFSHFMKLKFVPILNVWAQSIQNSLCGK